MDEPAKRAGSNHIWGNAVIMSRKAIDKSKNKNKINSSETFKSVRTTNI